MSPEREPARSGPDPRRRATLAGIAAAFALALGVGVYRHRTQDAAKWARAWARTDDPVRDRSPDTALILREAALTPGARVADVGAGAGYFTFRFAALVGPTGRVYATDVDPDMVEVVRNEAERRGTPQVTVQQVEGNDPGLAADSVDLIVMINSVPFTDCAEADARTYLRACQRALRPGGRVLVFRDYVHARGWRPPYGRALTCGELPPERIAALVADSFETRSLTRLSAAATASAGESPGFLLVLARKP